MHEGRRSALNNAPLIEHLTHRLLTRRIDHQIRFE
jgi:hypothetical protein